MSEITKLKKTLTREVHVTGRAVPLIIEITTEGIVRMREKRKRTWYEVSLDGVWWLAVKMAAEQLVEDRAQKKVRRGALRGITKDEN